MPAHKIASLYPLLCDYLSIEFSVVVFFFMLLNWPSFHMAFCHHVIPLILIQGTACPFGPTFISSHAAIFEIKMGLNVMQSSSLHGRRLAGHVPIQCITLSKDYPLPI